MKCGRSCNGGPPEDLEVESERGEWVDLGAGRVASDTHQIYRWRETGEFAHERSLHAQLTIRDGKISRFEMRIDLG